MQRNQADNVRKEKQMICARSPSFFLLRRGSSTAVIFEIFEKQKYFIMVTSVVFLFLQICYLTVNVDVS